MPTPPTLTPLGTEFADSLPSWLRFATSVLQVLDVNAREFERVEDAVEDITDQSNPQTATWGLKYFEEDLGLAVNPSGMTTADRRSLILATISSRFSNGAPIISQIKSMAPTSTQYIDHDNGLFFVRMPDNVPAELRASVMKLLRNSAPAHLQLSVEFESFIAGLSKAGDHL